MTSDRLTRQELSWLLAQEARGAARALREGVGQLKVPTVEIDSLPEVETNLDALDEAIERLTELQSGAQGKGRRGRIDLAALLYEVAPNARIAIEPGSGTEVFGEESELRRMLHVLVSQTNSDPSAGGAASPDITIRRQDEWVRISVELGPDSSATAELERRWLSRMAVRHGGRLELEGGTESILLPADGASDQREVAELRKELEQAQQLDEAYARELASMLAAGNLPSEPPPAPAPAGFERIDALAAGMASVARPLRALLEGLRSDGAELSAEVGEGSPIAQAHARRVSAGFELLAEVERVAQFSREESARKVDLSELIREAAAATEARAARHGVQLVVEVTRFELVRPRSSLGLLVRALLEHAIEASPRGAQVAVRLSSDHDGARLVVVDAGPVVPAAQRLGVLRRRVDPGKHGRPGGPSLLVADALALALGLDLALTESGDGRAQVEVRL